jgi:hypothetical protein
VLQNLIGLGYSEEKIQELMADDGFVEQTHEDLVLRK